MMDVQKEQFEGTKQNQVQYAALCGLSSGSFLKGPKGSQQTTDTWEGGASHPNQPEENPT